VVRRLLRPLQTTILLCRRGITVVLLTAATTAVAAWRNLFHVADGWLADHRERDIVDFSGVGRFPAYRIAVIAEFVPGF